MARAAHKERAGERARACGGGFRAGVHGGRYPSCARNSPKEETGARKRSGSRNSSRAHNGRPSLLKSGAAPAAKNRGQPGQARTADAAAATSARPSAWPGFTPWAPDGQVIGARSWPACATARAGATGRVAWGVAAARLGEPGCGALGLDWLHCDITRRAVIVAAAGLAVARLGVASSNSC